ncbi:MAG: hypothetical protein ACJAR3_002226 [Roseivirga sp.]|jgi:hypothetical protein
MDIDEIKRYCSTTNGICVYRKRVKKAQFIVQCIIIQGGRNDKYDVEVEFDPMGVLGQGEGVRWSSKENALPVIISRLETFSSLPLEAWQNYTKTGFEPHYDSEKVTREHYQKSWSTLETKYGNGELLLPKGLKFESMSIT